MKKKRNYPTAASEWLPSEKMVKFVEGRLSGMEIYKACTYAGCSATAYYTNWQNDARFWGYFEQQRLVRAKDRLLKVDNVIDRALEDESPQIRMQAAKVFLDTYKPVLLPALKKAESFDFSGMTTEELRKEAAKLSEELGQMANSPGEFNRSSS